MLRYKVYPPENFRFFLKKVFWHGFSPNWEAETSNANKPIPIPSGSITKGSASKIILYTIKTFDNDKH
jgi:hypothetical protein